MNNPVASPVSGDLRTKLEIGCGAKIADRADFIGLDRFPLDGVDVVFDLDAGSPLPFDSDTLDLVYASHSLEHVADLKRIMEEIWRVCKPGGQVCILAPYWQTSVHQANYYHKHNFNEHTPRFWTSTKMPMVPVREYRLPSPSGQTWGLANSDLSSPAIDLRCVRMEFFYHAPFRWFPARVLAILRRTVMDVCHSILYHLVAFKPPMTEDSLRNCELVFYIPPEVQSIRPRSSPRVAACRFN